MADLVRMFTAERGTTIADESFAVAAPPQVILEVEASAAEFAGGQAYRVGGFARNYVGPAAPLVPAPGVVTAGAINSPNWPTRNYQFVFGDCPYLTAEHAEKIKKGLLCVLRVLCGGRK